MPRSGERYPHQQDQHQQGRDGYDEDWDDDVYYAAASGPGKPSGVVFSVVATRAVYDTLLA